MNYDYRNEFTSQLYKDIQNLPSSDEMRLTSNEKVCQDKTTYCRPVTNYYDKQFIHKTMERNARLKRLVKNLAFARQKEKEKVSWNNFINDLKNKHALKTDDAKQTLSDKESDEYITAEIFNNYCKSDVSSAQSRPRKHLLHEVYGKHAGAKPHNAYHQKINEKSERKSQILGYLPHDRYSFCYPTSSQGRFIMMDRERRHQSSSNNCPCHLSNRYYIETKNQACLSEYDEFINTNMFNDNYSRVLYDRTTSFDEMLSIQADIQFYPKMLYNKYHNKGTCTMDQGQFDVEKFNHINANNEQRQEDSYDIKKLSLLNIDNKLQTLIESINSFIDEIKLNRQKRKKNKNYKDIKYRYSKCITDSESEIKYLDNDSFNKQKAKRKFDNITTVANHTCEFNCSDIYKSQKLKKKVIMVGDTTKTSKSVQFNKSLTNEPCSVQITFEIPTKECSTEVTKSLSKQNYFVNNKDVIEEINTLDNNFPHKQMTIAVNTDPLSFLSLLRVSTDTLKGLMSYMPNIDYYSYLSRLPLPQTTRNMESHYVCNICGAGFNKPSKLSDHIRDHNLGKTKDCCVCRHVLDAPRKIAGLFRCRYCGQPFVRAYCCELHQQTCAIRFGQHHDNTSSLMLLR